MCPNDPLEAFEGSPNTWEPPPCIELIHFNSAPPQSKNNEQVRTRRVRRVSNLATQSYLDDSNDTFG